MPTATTSHTGSARRAMEPYNFYCVHPQDAGGEFIVVNRALVRMLDEREWNEQGQGGDHHERGPSRARRGLAPADTRRFKTVWDLAEGPGTHATEPLTSASPSPPTFSCQRRRAARCRRLCSMGGKPTQDSVYHLRTAGGSCTALHDRPKAHVAQVAEERTSHSVCARREGQHWALHNAPNRFSVAAATMLRPR
jgi:hypothetical protein